MNHKPHILIINRYFYPDISSVPQLLTELAEDLTKAGNRVTVICSRNSYSGGERHPARETHNDIDISRVNNVYGRNKGILLRVLEAVTFFTMVFFRGLRTKNADMVMTLSSPPLLAYIGLKIARFKKAKNIYIIEDLHPNLAAALGFIKPGSFMYKKAWQLNRRVLKKCGKIVVLGKYMKAKVNETFPVPQSKIIEIPNWADGNRIYPVEKSENILIKEWNLENKFVVQYSGNMGLGHEFDTILKGMEQLKSYRDIHFVFIGDGPRKKEITGFIDQNRLTNVTCFPYQPYHQLHLSLSACDVALVSLKKEVQGLLAPSKIYGILASSKPFILVGNQNNEIADMALTHKIGRVIAEGDSNGFAQCILDYYNNREKAAVEGRAARELFEKEYDRKISTGKYTRVIEEMMD